MIMSDYINVDAVKADIEVAKSKVRDAQSWLKNLGDSIKAVFKEHKLEMLVAVAVGVVLGALFF